MNAARIATSFRRLGTSGARILTTACRSKSATAAPTSIPTTSQRVGIIQHKIRHALRNPNFALGIGGGLVLAGLHSATGSANDFYDYRFPSNKDPDDIASFYGGEELMELFCIFPIVGQIMMRNGRFDETGNFTTTGFPGRMKVSMVFSDEANEVTEETDWFNKRERFRDTLFGYTCWEMVLNFGFRTLEDGTRECYHFGEYFHGNLPIVSQIMLLIFKVHARWVAWSTEHHINHYAFSSGIDDDEEEMEEQSRANMPLFLLRNYALSDLTAMVFGYDNGISIEKQPSFLVTGGGDGSNEEHDDDALNRDIEEDKLPFQQKAIQIQISEDIAADKRVMKEILAGNNARDAEEVKVILVRRHTIARRQMMAEDGKGAANDGRAEEEEEEGDPPSTKDVYVLAKDLAVDRAQIRRLTRRRTCRLAATNRTKVDGEDADAIV